MTAHPAPSVLITDADPYICRVFEAKLTKDDPFRAMSVTTGQEALIAASHNVLSVILWDMRLRDTSRLLPRMRALCPTAVLILLTTDDRPTLDSDLARLDVADVLVKPLNLDTLVDRVRAALNAPAPASHTSPLDVARVGQRITLDSAQGGCVTRVLDNRADTFIVVGEPRVRVPSDFRPGLIVQTRIAGEDAMYSFKTKLLRHVEEPIGGWEVQKPRTIRRDQRRRSPRQQLSCAITIEPLEGRGAGSRDGAGRSEIPSVDGQTEDVGIGGCALVADTALPEGTPVHFVLEPSTEQAIMGAGTVLRSARFSPSGTSPASSHFRLALQFRQLPPVSRRRLRDILDPHPDRIAIGGAIDLCGRHTRTVIAVG